MKLIGGNWFPDHETHMAEWMEAPVNKVIVDGKLTYQYRKQQAALKNVKNWRTAVDIGGHVGLWSTHLVKKFDQVHAFEPIAAHRECFVLNVPTATLHPYALGAAPGMVGMFTQPGSSGHSLVRGKGDVEMRTLDSFNLENVDFLKVDCEGYELFVLQGAVETIKRCRPAMCVEQKGFKEYGFKTAEAVAFLKKLGASQREVISGDYMMSFD